MCYYVTSKEWCCAEGYTVAYILLSLTYVLLLQCSGQFTYHMMISHTKGFTGAVTRCSGTWPKVSICSTLAKSPFHLATNTNTSLSPSKSQAIHKGTRGRQYQPQRLLGYPSAFKCATDDQRGSDGWSLGAIAQHFVFLLLYQGVRTETVFGLVWLNQFTETSFKEPFAFRLFLWNRFRLHMIAYLPVEYLDDRPIFVGVIKDDTVSLR